jgi:hypothetical protein
LFLPQLYTFDFGPGPRAQDLAFCVPRAEDLDPGSLIWRYIDKILAIRMVSRHKPMAFWHIVWTLGVGALRAQRRGSGPWALDLATVIRF